MNISEIKDFSNQIVEIGEEYNCKPIISWAKKLGDYASQFDSNRISICLEQFPELVKALKDSGVRDDIIDKVYLNQNNKILPYIQKLERRERK
jgi:hypothetical protein